MHKCFPQDFVIFQHLYVNVLKQFSLWNDDYTAKSSSSRRACYMLHSFAHSLRLNKVATKTPLKCEFYT